MEYVLVGLRSLIGLVFLVSIVSKLRSRRSYAEFVTATGRLSPRPVAGASRWWLATGVLAAECIVLALVLIPATVPVGFGMATGLLLAFTGAILLALRRGERAPCRCFGSTDQPLGYPHVARNIGLVAVCLLGIVVGQLPTATPHPAGTVLAVAAGAIAATMVVMIDDIAALFRPA